MLHKLALFLLIIGGFNWFVFAIWNRDIGSWLLGGMGTQASTILYIAFGVAAFYEVLTHRSL